MFKIEKEIFESYPNLIVGVLVLKNIDNSQEVKEVGDLLKTVYKLMF